MEVNEMTSKEVKLSVEPCLTADEGHLVCQFVDELCSMRGFLKLILDRLYKCSDCSLPLRKSLYALRCGNNAIDIAVELLQESLADWADDDEDYDDDD